MVFLTLALDCYSGSWTEFYLSGLSPKSVFLLLQVKLISYSKKQEQQQKKLQFPSLGMEKKNKCTENAIYKIQQKFYDCIKTVIGNLEKLDSKNS